MALPYLTKYIYNNGTDEVIRRGKKIHSIGNVELVNVDDLMGAITFRVKDDMYATYYKVYIEKYKDEKNLAIRCGCPYNLGEICRHEAAALFQLQEMLDKNMLGEKDLTYRPAPHRNKDEATGNEVDQVALVAPNAYEAADCIFASI